MYIRRPSGWAGGGIAEFLEEARGPESVAWVRVRVTKKKKNLIAEVCILMVVSTSTRNKKVFSTRITITNIADKNVMKF